MTIKELYQQAMRNEAEYGGESLTLLLEFLVIEKQTVSWDDEEEELDLYFKPNNRPRMNKLLLEYKERM